ncbi:hypothetical protein [Lichenicoccus sp.]|uniref:hypothetical protein n=1 Tax=Lichenicoccus sp. TaxID=2781899 RepID=UPI003D0FC491
MRRDLRGAVAALGNFDGVHGGHQSVIARAVEMARDRGVAAVVATFDPHPIRHLKPGTGPFALTTLDQRRTLLRAEGVDALLVFGFDDRLAKATPTTFVRDWLGQLGGVVTGRNFAFGHRRAGSVEMLCALAHEHGLTSDTVGPVVLGGGMVSSSRIRAALAEGRCAEAAHLLSRPFCIEGVIRHRWQKRPAWELSNASLDLGEYLRPRCGVYGIRGRLDDGRILWGSAAFTAPIKEELYPAVDLFLPELGERDFGRMISVELIGDLHHRESYDVPIRSAPRTAACLHPSRQLLATPSG